MSSQLATKPRRFTTDELPERERLSRWREEFGRTLVLVDIEPLPSELPFRSEAVMQTLPGVRMAFCSGAAARFNRTRALTADCDESVSLIVNTGARTLVTQRDHEVTLAPGDGVALSTDEPGLLIAKDHFGVLIPRVLLALRIDDLDRMLMRPIPSDNEALRLLVGYVTMIQNAASTETPAVREAIASHIHDLAALAIAASRDTRELAKGAVAAARLAAVIAYIGRNFADPALSVAAVARDHDISPRYLQELLEQSGTSFVPRVNELRLKRALALLTRFPNRPIAEIAAQAGFSNVSHFNRLFRQRFGDSPSGVRVMGSS